MILSLASSVSKKVKSSACGWTFFMEFINANQKNKNAPGFEKQFEKNAAAENFRGN